ncbi:MULTISPECIES: phytoene desaturase family protein [unclassified Lysobacter]
MSATRPIGIVGGGVAGLATGIALLRRGLPVTIYEAADRPGGCCTTTELSGYTFNDGAIYVAVPEILDHGFQRLGLDRKALLPLRQITAMQTTTVPDGTTVSFAHGLELRIDGTGGPERTAAGARELEALVARWEPMLRLIADELVVQPFSLVRLLRKGWRELPKLRGTVGSQLEKMVDDPALRAALGGISLYTGLPPAQTPAMQMIGLVGMLTDRFWLPEGGMGRIPDVLADTFVGLGGQLRVGARVERIVVKDGRVRGIDVVGQGRFEHDAVVSTTSGMTTATTLLDPDCVPNGMRRKTENAPLSQRALSLQLGLTNVINVPSHFMYRLPWLQDQQQALVPVTGVPQWLSYTVPTVTMPELAPPGGSIIELYPTIDQTLPVAEWNDERAASIADAAIEALSRLHPIDIAVKRVRSPADFRHRMHLYEGAIYGLSPGADAGAQFPHRTAIAGLFQAGQTTWPGFGVATSLMSGVLAAEALAG